MAKVLHVVDMDRCIGCYSCMLACARTVRQDFSPTRASLQIRTAGGFSSKFVGEICRGCLNAPCALACRYEALLPREGGGVRFNPEKCVGCRACVEACIIDVLHFDEVRKQPLPCIQCGVCASYCPHVVLAMEVRAGE